MSFFKEVFAAMGLDSAPVANGYQIINYNGKAVYCEGFKRILSIGGEEVILGLKAKRIVVSGSNLTIKELENNTVIICGEIKSVTEEGI